MTQAAQCVVQWLDLSEFRAAPALVVRADTVYVWLTDPDACRTPRTIRACGALLAPDEEKRYVFFSNGAAAHLYLIGRAAARTALSRHSDVAPQAWCFAYEADGRPLIADSRVALDFNLSHTAGMVACAVVSDARCGVDVEHTGRPIDPLVVASREFSAREFKLLRRLAPRARRECFFALWTLKEAYLKARGTGLAVPLRDIEFGRDRAKLPVARFGQSIRDDVRHWHFHVAKVTRWHVLAVAVASFE